jgi:hypothetical protein
MIVTYPNNVEETNAIKAVLKVLKVRYEISDGKLFENLESNKNKILDNIKIGLTEVDQFKKGTLKTTSAKDFLNEF